MVLSSTDHARKAPIVHGPRLTYEISLLDDGNTIGVWKMDIFHKYCLSMTPLFDLANRYGDNSNKGG